MDVCQAVSAYVERMVKEVRGMKMLLLDDHTTPCLLYTSDAADDQSTV